MSRLAKNRIFQIAACTFAIVAGLFAGSAAWNQIGGDLMPDLSEPPAIISFHKPAAR